MTQQQRQIVGNRDLPSAYVMAARKMQQGCDKRP